VLVVGRAEVHAAGVGVGEGGGSRRVARGEDNGEGARRCNFRSLRRRKGEGSGRVRRRRSPAARERKSRQTDTMLVSNAIDRPAAGTVTFDARPAYEMTTDVPFRQSTPTAKRRSLRPHDSGRARSTRDRHEARQSLNSGPAAS